MGWFNSTTNQFMSAQGFCLFERCRCRCSSGGLNPHGSWDFWGSSARMGAPESQRGPPEVMGNPYIISPIAGGYLWVSYPQESLENTINTMGSTRTWTGYTRPCPLILNWIGIVTSRYPNDSNPQGFRAPNHEFTKHYRWLKPHSGPKIHQEFFVVPKMEGFLNLSFGYFGGGFSLT